MRLSTVLLRQHIGFHFKKHWIIQGKRVPMETGADVELAARGIPVVDPNELIKDHKVPLPRLKVIGQLPPEVQRDENHPLYKPEECYLYGDRDVLLEGVRQAQVLLNTVVYDELPLKMKERLDRAKVPTQLDRSMQQSILAALVFDAEQVKRPIVKVPERPAYKLPREYGISNERRNRLLLSKFVTHCERLAGQSVTSTRKVIANTRFLVPMTKDLDRIQLSLKVDTLVTSAAPITPLDKSIYRPQDQSLPDIFPLNQTVSIPTTNFYEWLNEYPIGREYKFSHPHTVLLHCAPEDVANLFETPVTDDQKDSRAMIKGFAVAAARARQLYGDNVGTLPHPITVQVIQTDSKWFHFSIFQLNTLNLDGSNENDRNLWFRKPRMDLYSECGYLVGKPSLLDYDKEVLKHFAVFYESS
ncbi:39S ribosomal protein L37, mitochondrial [Toxorhynchites rutilus septentrionalis]|uniref:39S ribosomal protein L37, mitochondrial n=1 Tax=Toxorhynchites rutilus septentrionalis TaxID=329112 RepID=UPI00247A70B2|nr:39S ribosomal protein L37, mitochondrial [Toxorhynchites rutilus septentrionalis]